MPYIGNQHNVGDHVNNFKVLDDISSHTATFDGSATSVVSAADDTIRIPEHRFIQGQRVTYTNGGGGNIGGLTSGQIYFITFHTKNTIKLATNLQNANNNVVVNLSSVGSGTSHTINAAFDGINTKFKITYEGGKEGRFNNATQLNIAINNVIQRPNINPITFTEGFAIEDHHKIIFKVAPTVNDIFWGSIIANTIENFDLRDNEVDNFTGDGSATEFTLSTIPANNESVIVTIDGVLQHPSDKNVSRAYTLIDSVIQFTAAPALNAEIQVRHIGFAGASTADVSGFYGRTGNVTLTANDHITTGDITSRNINASGIVTASTFDGAFTGNVVGTSATFTGNLTVGGVLTYEDVTNVDSVGIITAQKDIHVGAGVSAVGVGTFGGLVSSDLTVEKSGNLSVNIKSTGGYGALEVGGTSSGYVDIKKPFSADFDLRLMHDGNNSYITSADKPLHFDAYSYKGINIGALGQTDLRYAGNVKLKTETGGVSVTGILTATSLDVSTDLDVDGHTNLDNVSVAGVTTFAGAITAPDVITAGALLHEGDTNTLVHFSADDTIELKTHGYSRLSVTNNGVALTGGYLNSNGNRIILGDSSGANDDRLVLGNTNDLQLYHNGSDSYIENATGVLKILGNDIQLGEGNDSVGIGTHAPGYKLELYTSGGSTNLKIGSRMTDSDYGIAFGYFDEMAGKHGFGIDRKHGGTITSNGFVFRADTGRVGIGTDSPTNKFEVYGTDATVTLLNYGQSSGGLAAFTSQRLAFVSTHVNDNLVFGYSNSSLSVGNFVERMRIDNGTGNVGIGTNNPVRPLHIHAADCRIRLEDAGVATDVEIQNVSGDAVITTNGASNLRLQTNNTERLRIDSSGNVNFGANKAVSLPSGTGIQVYNSSAPRIKLVNDTTGNAAGDGLQIYVTGSSAIFDHKENAEMRFYTNATERVRITSGGEVGIRPGGITPTAGDLATGDSQNTPLLHVSGQGTSDTGGVYNLLARFQAGGDSDGSGGMIVINHNNDRGLAIQGGRRTGNYAHGALKMIDNVGRLSSALVIHGGPGVGIDNMGFYTGNSTTTTERFHLGPTGNFAFYNNGGDNRIERNTTSGGPYLLFHNRGTNTTDSSGVYNLGGISAAGYRDVANPGIVGSMQFVRQPTAGGASSGCDIIFRTGFNGTTSHTGVSERMRISYTGAISSAVTRQALSYTALATPTYYQHSATGNTNVTIDVSSVFGVPDNAKAILVQGWYHVLGYAQGSNGQADHATSHFSERAHSGGAPWSFYHSTNTGWGQYIMEHDGDSSGSMHYYGMWGGQGVVNVNPNGNIYGALYWGYSGGTHYNQLWCFGYYM